MYNKYKTHSKENGSWKNVLSAQENAKQTEQTAKLAFAVRATAFRYPRYHCICGKNPRSAVREARERYFSAVAAVGFSTRLRHVVLKHILGLSYSQVDQLGTSTMITRMTSDINQVQNGVNLTLRLLLRSPCVCLAL